MDQYKKYYGVITFLAIIAITLYASYSVVFPKYTEKNDVITKLESKKKELESKSREKTVVENKIKKIKDSIVSSQKRVYAPTESDLGNDTLFFNLYNDIIDMLHANSIRIKSIKYTYNPADDEFVKFGKDAYFVCDINLDLISNYVNLGKLIQDIYQYPYYIKINSLEVTPYPKDKKVLTTKLSLRLYANTEPKDLSDLELQ